MKISVEITLAPLHDEFKDPIKNFIKKLRASDLVILENPLSTQVFGEYDQVMKVLTEEIKEAFELIEKGIIFIKIVKSDRQNYAPSF